MFINPVQLSVSLITTSTILLNFWRQHFSDKLYGASYNKSSKNNNLLDIWKVLIAVTRHHHTLYEVNCLIFTTDDLNDASSNDTYAGSVKDNPHSPGIGNKNHGQKINIQYNYIKITLFLSWNFYTSKLDYLLCFVTTIMPRVQPYQFRENTTLYNN